VFGDPAMTLAAVDRLVHHATLFEMNVESFRRRAAVNRKHNGLGRPPTFATPKNVGLVSSSDNQPEKDVLPTTDNSGTISSPRHPPSS
jgi:IstB-like ATP binding protein